MKPLVALCRLTILARCVEVTNGADRIPFFQAETHAGTHIPREPVLPTVRLSARSVGRRPCTVVAADYDDPEGVTKLRALVNRTDCDLHVIEKSSLCPDQVDCQRVSNLGMEGGSAADFIYENYDSLPDVLIFTPTTLSKWRRQAAVTELLENRRSGRFQCIEMHRGSVYESRHMQGGFQWNGKDLDGSNSRREETTLYEWMVGRTDLHSCLSDKKTGGTTPVCEMLNAPVCAHMVFRTTRALLLQRPREMYLNISRSLNKWKNPLSGHFLEKAVGAVFAGTQDWWTETVDGGEMSERTREEKKKFVNLSERIEDDGNPTATGAWPGVSPASGAGWEQVSMEVGAHAEIHQLRQADRTNAYQW